MTTKVDNVSYRLHLTAKIETPWSGQLSELIGAQYDSFVLMLVGVPPARHEDDERLTVFTQDVRVETEHALGWLMDVYCGNHRSEEISELCRSATELVDQARESFPFEDRSTAMGTPMDVTEQELKKLERAASVARLASEAAAAEQNVGGVRLGRAVLLNAGETIAVRTSMESKVICYLGGLAARKVAWGS